MRMTWPAIEDGLLTETYPAAWEPFHVALIEGPVLLSYATVMRRTIEHAGATYRLAGLGNVLTYPGFRRRGYGARVVRAATAHIDASDADVGGLFCVPALVPFYARADWEPLRVARTTHGIDDVTVVKGEVRMMRFLSIHGLTGREAFAIQPLHLDYHW